MGFSSVFLIIFRCVQNIYIHICHPFPHSLTEQTINAITKSKTQSMFSYSSKLKNPYCVPRGLSKGILWEKSDLLYVFEAAHSASIASKEDVNQLNQNSQCMQQDFAILNNNCSKERMLLCKTQLI